MTEPPNTDLSALFVQIQADAEAVAFRQVQGRLRAYTEAVGAKAGQTYQNWKQLPEKALISLSKRLKEELAAIPPEKPKAIASPQVEEVSEEEFF